MADSQQQSPAPTGALANIRRGLSRGVSQFLMGQRGSVEQKSSFWRLQHQQATTATPDTQPRAVTMEYSSSDDDYSESDDEPWWMQDALWEVEDDIDYPNVPPPSYDEAVGSEPQPVELHYELPELGPPPAYDLQLGKPSGDGEVQVSSLGSSGAVPSLKLDTVAQNYKGRGRGRNRNAHLKQLATVRNATVRGLNPQQIQSGAPKIDLGNEDGAGRGPLTRAASLQDVNRLRKRPPVKPPRVKVLSKPYFIATVSIIQVILMIWELIAGGGFLPFSENPFLGPGPETYIIFGGKWVPSIRGNGEWWRFVSAIFLHSGLAHIAFNLLSQIKIGFDLERVHGTYRLFPIYILSGIFGNVVSAIFLPRSVTVGASGSIFGFFGVLLVDLIKNWKKLPRPGRNLAILIVSIIISFAFGLLPGVDNWAHGAGFVMGLLSGIVFLPSMHIGKFNIRRRLLQVIISLPLMVGAFVGVFYVFYRGLPDNFCPWCSVVTCLPVFPACRPQTSAAPSAGPVSP